MKEILQIENNNPKDKQISSTYDIQDNDKQEGKQSKDK